MKKILTILLSLSTLTAFSQSIDKLTIQKCYSNGLNVLEKLKNKDTTGLSNTIDSISLEKLFDCLDKKESRINQDIYYDYRVNNFVFTIYSGISIDNETDWGLYNYDFILTLYYKYENEKFTIVKATSIFDNKQKKRIWWQSLMDSYKDKKYLRKDWADKFGLVPPPPPPPESTEWFKKEK